MTWPTSSRPSTRPRKQTSRRRLVILVALGCATLGGGLIVVGVFPQEPLRRFVEGRLRRASGPQSRLADLRLIPGRLRGQVRGLVLVGDGYRVEVAEVRFALSFSGLLQGKLAFRFVEALQPVVVLTDAAIPSAWRAPASLPATVEMLRVQGGRLEVDYAALGGPLVVPVFDARGSIGHGTLAITAPASTWKREKPVGLGPLLARLSVSESLAVRLEELEAGTPWSRLRVSGDVGPLAAPDLALTLEAHFDARDAALFGLDDGQGRLRLNGTLFGKLPSLRLEGRAVSEGFTVEGTRVDRLDASFLHQGPLKGTMEGPSKSTMTLDAHLLGGRVRAEGGLERGELSARAVMTAFDLTRLPGASAVATAGTLSGQVEAQGRWGGVVPLTARLVASGVKDALGGTGHLEASAWGSFRPAEAKGNGQWRIAFDRAAPRDRDRPGVGAARLTASGTVDAGGPLRVEGRAFGQAEFGTGRGPGQVLPVRGSFALVGDDLRADLEALEGSSLRITLRAREAGIERLLARAAAIDLQPFLGAGGGFLDLDADLAGAWERLTGTASLRLRELRIREASLGDAEVRLVLHEGSGRLDLTVPALGAKGEASLRLGAGGAAQGAVRLTSLDLARLAPLLPESLRARPVAGQVTAEIDFDLPFAGDRDPKLAASISRMEATSGEWSVELTARRIVLESGGIRLEGIGAFANGTRAALSGRVGFGTRSSDLVIHLDSDLARWPAPPPWRLEGSVVLDARLHGTLARPELDGGLNLTGLSVRRGGEAPALLALPEGRMSLAGDRLEWTSLEASLAGGSVATDGSVPLGSLVTGAAGSPSGGARAQEARVRVTWRDVALGRLLEAARPAGGSPLEAAVSGELALDGSVIDPRRWSGHLALGPVQAKAGGLDVELDAVRMALEQGILTLPQLRLQAAGQVVVASARVDLESGDLKATAAGRLDLRALAPLVEPAAGLQGDADLDLEFGGSWQEPLPRGSLVLRDVSVRAAAFPQALTGVAGRVSLGAGSLRVEGLSGRLGGGAVKLSGAARVSGMTLSDVDLTVSGRDLALRYPLDFKSRVGADLHLGGGPGAFLLTGEVRVERGLYDTDMFLDEFLRGNSAAPAAEVEVLPWLRSVSLDLDVRARDRIVVRNNLAQLTARGSARVRGDLAAPAPYGRFELGEGGTIFLQTRKFTVDRGSLSFEGTLDPVISLRAESVIRQVGDEDVEVTVTASGPLRKPSLTLSSDPSYSEREIVSLIATGRRGLALDSSAWVAGEQAASLLAGRLTRNVARGLMDLGLDEVDIQPELLAREADPGARFTFGKNLTPRAKLVYSVGLNDPEATFFLGEYRVRVGAEATARVQRDDEGEYTYGLGQRFRLGGPARRRRGTRTGLRTEISEVDLAGHLGLPEAELRKAVHAEAGEVVSPWDLQEDAGRLEEKLVSAGHLEALVSARAEDTVARFEVESGPRYRAEVRGLESPPDLDSLIRQTRFEGEAVTRSRDRLFAEASSRGFPHARIKALVVDEGEDKAIVFEVDLGPHIARTEALFPGARKLSAGRLLEASGGAAAILRDPEGARRRVREEYRRAHYLAAEVDAPGVEEQPDGSRLTVRLAVREGPQAHLASVRFEGATVAGADLQALARLEVGKPFDPSALPPAVERIRDFYLKKGFAAARVIPRLEPKGSDYDVVFGVEEGQARTIGSIVVFGQRRTRESVIRSRIELRPGEPLDPRRLVVAERRILELDVFSRVAVTASEDEPATVRVEVAERGPYALAYDVRYNAADHFSGVLDAEAGNLGGYALAVGGRYRQGSDLREMRGSLSLPVLGRTRGFLATLFRQDEEFLLVREGVGEEAPPPAFLDTERQQGFEIQQAMKLANKWDALYGYRFQRVSSRATGFEQDVSSLGFALLRETRDNPLDARRGRFWSLSFDLAPKQLGSDLVFFRAYGQGFFIRSIGPSWTWGQGYRLGMANGLREKQGEQVQILGRATELFRAGGAASLRGFASDSVGPPGLVPGLSRGGEAVVILNQEIRFHHPSGFGAAAFYDVGNVFERVSDISFSLRHSVGLGVRYASPVGLLRFDVGFPLGRRPGERAYQWFFTLGQVF